MKTPHFTTEEKLLIRSGAITCSILLHNDTWELFPTKQQRRMENRMNKTVKKIEIKIQDMIDEYFIKEVESSNPEKVERFTRFQKIRTE